VIFVARKGRRRGTSDYAEDSRGAKLEAVKGVANTVVRLHTRVDNNTSGHIHSCPDERIAVGQALKFIAIDNLG
jgi:hypothetical protein